MITYETSNLSTLDEKKALDETKTFSFCDIFEELLLFIILLNSYSLLPSYKLLSGHVKHGLSSHSKISNPCSAAIAGYLQ